MSLSELSKYVFTSKYARYIPEKKRRETWHEAVTRVKEMHLGKFPDLAEEIEWAFNFVYKKKASPSQRTLQFGGDAVLKHNTRAYNCCATYVDRPRVFQEIMYCLLCGTGVGFSVQKQHVDKLPELYYGKKKQKTFTIPDTIEGWSDAVGVLVSSYFVETTDSPAPDFVKTEVNFDYSQIRPKGSKLSSSSGKAPGPKPLETALEKIRSLLDDAISNKQIKLKPIQVHDIICHLADAVLSGGVRRSSCISLFSINDEEMMSAKTGDWFYTNPQRARANNSVVLNRNRVTKEDLCKLIENIKQYGEPGISLSSLDDGSEVTNPCHFGRSVVVTPAKMAVLDDIKVGDTIWSEDGWVTVTNKVCTGVKDVWRYRTTAGCVYCTPNHRILQNREKIEIALAESVDILAGPDCEPIDFDKQIVMDGVVFGDGSFGKTARNAVLYIGQNDGDYFEYFGELINKKRVKNDCAWYISTTMEKHEIPYTFERTVPDRFKFADKKTVLSFLRGVYTANGSICGNRVTLKTASKNLVEDIQIMLSSVGICSYFTTNKSTKVKFRNGEYTCKQRYDININADREKFAKLIGFVQNYKTEKLNQIIELNKNSNSKKLTYDIIEAEYYSTEPVYDITVSGEHHTYWHGGHNVSNCHEISLHPQIDCKSGIQFCNLTSINVKKCKTQEEFYEAAKAAAIIGTLQAAYTDFPYLGKITEEITRKEALLGVCLSGMMDNPNIALDAKTQAKAAKVVLETNKEFAKKLGINPAARATSVKPSGTDSLVAETSAGIHPHHSRRYLRRAQANDTESVARHFANHNPMAVEKSVWGASGSDLSLIFCVETEEGARTKNDVSAIDLLKAVKTTKDSWIKYGKNESLCSHPALSHNVSNTIHIKDHEWDEAINYIYENLDSFGGISFLPHSGDLDYHQPPFCAVHTPKEILKKYGDASIFASGLIVDGMYNFGDLWTACDAVLGRLNQFEETPETKQWIYKVNKFAHKYYDGDVRKVTYLMKEVYNWKKWLDLNVNYQQVDYTTLIEGNDDTSLEENLACSGGSCEII